MLFLFLILTQTVPQDTAPQERPNSLANLPESKLMMPLLIISVQNSYIITTRQWPITHTHYLDNS